jgi:hypothetical protein
LGQRCIAQGITRPIIIKENNFAQNLGGIGRILRMIR